MTLNPIPYILDPKPLTLNPKPLTLKELLDTKVRTLAAGLPNDPGGFAAEFEKKAGRFFGFNLWGLGLRIQGEGLGFRA